MNSKQFVDFLKTQEHAWNGFVPQSKMVSLTANDYATVIKNIYQDVYNKFCQIEPQDSASCFLVYEQLDNNFQYVKSVVYGDFEHVAFRTCEISAWSDFTGDKIDQIVLNGDECELSGWLPNMKFIITTKATGAIVYENIFPTWDH